MNSKHARVLLAVFGVIAVSAIFVSAAAAREPAPGYGKFASCPSPEEVANIEGCLVSTITGGHFQLGSKDVPIKNPITLAGGITTSGHLVYNKKGGLTPVKEQVPGGVIGLTGLDWLVNFLGIEALQLYAVTEIAGTVGNPFGETFTLPVKVHLINPVLGNNCYVGSNSNPINLNLTVNTTSPPPPNKPISGTPPELELDPSLEGVIDATDGVYADNAFAAPGATGCTLTLFGFIPISLNGLVNAESGLPAPAGTNATTQNFSGQLAFYPFVYNP
jgi:hypothetical protein